MALYKASGGNKAIVPVPKGHFLYKDSYCTIDQREIDTTGAYINYAAHSSTYVSDASGKSTWVLVNPEGLSTLKFKLHENAMSLTVKALKKDLNGTVETIDLDSNDIATVTNPSQYALVYAFTGGAASYVYLRMLAR